MEDKNWFEAWFNSPYYHLLYNRRDIGEADFFINNLSKHLNLPAAASIWDIACGKGRHAVAFSRKGFQVTGTDLSDKSIQQANELQAERAEFFVHDMRLPFRENHFDCALNLFTSLGYFENHEDNFTVFTNVYRALKNKGLFVIDFFNSEKVIKSLNPKYTEERGDISFHITKEISSNFIHKKITFEHEQKFFAFQESVELLRLEHFEAFGKRAGFVLESVFGDYGLNPFDANVSDRLILIFKK
jgi:SAM-dependent methyltransferase